LGACGPCKKTNERKRYGHLNSPEGPHDDYCKALEKKLSSFVRSTMRNGGKKNQIQQAIGCVVVPAQTVDATLACSLLAGVSNPRVFLGR